MPGSRAIRRNSLSGAYCRTATCRSREPAVRLNFVAEFSFQNARCEENTRRAELRPIPDREFARWQLVFNPVFERALHGPGTRHGWNFEPALLLRRKRRGGVSPSVEY